MQTNSPILKPMKATLVAIAMLVSAASIQAQGVVLQSTDFGVGSVVDSSSLSISTESVNFNTGGVNFINGDSYGGLPQPQSFQGIEIYRDTDSGIDVLPPTPLPDPSPPSSDFQPSLTSSIQPAPEPSTLALGGLSLGLIALTRVNRHQQILKR
jgi:hypothetical protein